MAVFTWDERYETGYPEIDADHRQLVDSINRLFEAMDNGTPLEVYGHLRVVHLYVTGHFAREEALIDQVGYPDALAHKAMHESFAARYVNFMDRDPKVLLVKMSVFLHDWLHHHILVEDKKLFDFARSQKPPV